MVLTAKKTEAGDAVEAFLDVLHGKDYPDDNGIIIGHNTFTCCLDMADKYQYHPVIQNLPRHLYRHTFPESGQVFDSMSIFIIAARRGAKDLCAALIARPHGDEK